MAKQASVIKEMLETQCKNLSENVKVEFQIRGKQNVHSDDMQEIIFTCTAFSGGTPFQNANKFGSNAVSDLCDYIDSKITKQVNNIQQTCVSGVKGIILVSRFFPVDEVKIRKAAQKIATEKG